MQPVVVATWKFGEIAARTALPLLTQGRAALDAALAGAQAVVDGCRHSLPGFMRPFRTNSCLRHP
jgi:hypothetical protein